MDSIRKLFVWSLCLLLGFSYYVSSSGEILCFDEQGQVRVKAAHIQPCGETDQAVATATIDPEAQHHHDCVDCSNVPLDSPQWWQRSKVTDRPITRAMALATVYLTIDQAAASGTVWATLVGTRPTFSIETAPAVLLC